MVLGTTDMKDGMCAQVLTEKGLASRGLAASGAFMFVDSTQRPLMTGLTAYIQEETGLQAFPVINSLCTSGNPSCCRSLSPRGHLKVISLWLTSNVFLVTPYLRAT